jgi:hypothetical protein
VEGFVCDALFRWVYNPAACSAACMAAISFLFGFAQQNLGIGERGRLINFSDFPALK